MKNFKIKKIQLDTVDSTNNYAFALAEAGEKEIVIVSAKTQINGRGRFQRKWLSPEGGIYVSFLFQPQNPLKEMYFFPAICGLAVVKTIEDIVSAEIKWPNDVLVKSKKIAGVLVEAKSSKQYADFVVVGIGLNVNIKKEDLGLDATSLSIETGKAFSCEKLQEKMIKRMLSMYKLFCKQDIAHLIKEIFVFQHDREIKPQEQVEGQDLKDVLRLR